MCINIYIIRIKYLLKENANVFIYNKYFPVPAPLLSMFARLRHSLPYIQDHRYTLLYDICCCIRPNPKAFHFQLAHQILSRRGSKLMFS